MNLILVEPTLEEYWYEQKLQSDPLTMNYNAGYDVNYYGYHYDTGCIDFPKERWILTYEKRQKDPQRYFAYIKDLDINKYVGYVNYHYSQSDNRYGCGIVIEAMHRGKGYSKRGLQLLCQKAFSEGIDKLYDNFEEERKTSLKVFESLGFKVVDKIKYVKFNKEVDLVVVCLEKENFIKEDL
jgi:RimJ/RimL family protein N-acetyltransferase